VPADWPVVIERAEHFVARSTEGFDVVLCDIFAGEAHPDCLFDSYFYADLAARLGHDGVLALNLSPQEDGEVAAILAALRQSIDWVMLAPIAGHGNVVVLASPAPPPSTDTMAARAAALAASAGLDPSAVLPAFTRLPGRHEIWGGQEDEDEDEDEHGQAGGCGGHGR
jgi:spermidine synthase